MRHMKPLLLPALVAQRKASLDTSNHSQDSLFSSTDSGFAIASDSSVPPSPTIHRAHRRISSSTSSLSSTPPSHDFVEPLHSAAKLPQLTEEPVERLDDDDDELDQPFRYPLSDMIAYGQGEDEQILEAYNLSGYGPDSPSSKRRRSGELSNISVTDRIQRSFPSLSRKIRGRDRASTLDAVSRSATPSRVPSTRSSSITSSIHQLQNLDSARLPPTSTPSLRNVKPSAPETVQVDMSEEQEAHKEEVQTNAFVTTPLLPPVLVAARNQHVPAPSPLQSPTVAMADPMRSVGATPVASPTWPYPTPPLSTKASIASFRARSSPLVPASEIPPMMLADPNDKWTSKLGHDNFTIHPLPYLPECCDAASLKQLFADWEQARRNFTKHQVRMAEHNGPTSTVYQLCEQKWAEIDAAWKANHDEAIARAAAMGEEPAPCSPSEPAPLMTTIPPVFSNPGSDGKFPNLGDEDIVGPMTQIASPRLPPPSPSKKRAFLRFFSDLKFPGSFLGRASHGIRTR